MQLLILVLSLTGCKQDAPNKGNNVMHGTHAPTYFLIADDDSDPTTFTIYEIADPKEVKKIDNWTKSHIDRRRGIGPPRGLVLLYWHLELLRFDGDGQVVQVDDLGNPARIRGNDYFALKEMFEKHGKRVGTIPGRKPPKRQKDATDQVIIEYEDPSTPSEIDRATGRYD